MEEIAEFYTHFYGEEVTREQIGDMGWQCMQDEWAFNRGAGFGPEDDEMPDCMKQDAIGPEKYVWDIPQELVVTAYERCEPRDELYTQRPA
jgi:aldehyde:ferredoxin oxidoreductase